MTEQPSPAQPPRKRVVGSETQKLKVVLTEAEKGRNHETLLRCHGELAALEREETEIKAQLKRRRAGIETRLQNCVSLLNAGYEFRDVEVDRVADYEAGLVRLVRQDTGEEIDVERLSDKERQTAFDLPMPTPQATDDAPQATDDDGGWGAPSTGAPPTLGLGHDADVVDAEFVEGPPPADVPRDTTPIENPLDKLVSWYKEIGRDKAREDMESREPDEVRDLYLHMVPGAPVARSRKSTLVAAILMRLFGEDPPT